jgi:transcriptional regulator GlxA family with amidase domain
LRARHARGVKLVSVCSGAFVLGEAGLLDGRSVTTHYVCAGRLAERFPGVGVELHRRIIDDGDILSAGGFLAWADVGLLLVDRILGPAVRDKVARFMGSDSNALAANYFVGFAPTQAHGDSAILRAQELVHTQDGQNLSLAALSTAAKLERRTFLRRFAKATGVTPIEYCRAVRIARGRELLEFGNWPLKEIAISLGYQDVASFSRIFRKRTGLAPGAYRKMVRSREAST